MKIVAKTTFAGKVSMYKGEEKDIESEETLSELLKAGYVERIEEPVKVKKDNTKKASDSNEGK